MSGRGASETQAGTGTTRGERIAKVIARAGICSRRDAERLIFEGRVKLNGRTLSTPAITVGAEDKIEVNGEPLARRERTRLWLFHKPKGLVTTNRDPQGRPTIFTALPKELPRVVTVGRLDLNTEGLLLLTNDGGLARVLELPSTGWLRRYRVRAHGQVDQAALERLARGVTIEGMVYGAIEAVVERLQGSNVWLNIGLREGKNREVKRVLEHLGLTVNRLIRVSYGPFQLGDLTPGEVREVRGRVLKEQLGARLAAAAHADFEAPIRQAQREAPAAMRFRKQRPPGELADKRAKRHAHRRRPL
jgi:23S rRNA pseudouridine2605 synthase